MSCGSGADRCGDKSTPPIAVAFREGGVAGAVRRLAFDGASAKTSCVRLLMGRSSQNQVVSKPFGRAETYRVVRSEVHDRDLPDAVCDLRG